MCGICGVVRLGSHPPGEEARLLTMRDVMVHRGPDGAGLFLDDGIGLGHRRLSIVDVAHGQQPMRSADDRFVVVFNGEVFNHPMLQPMLERDGARYRTRSDTETILHLFERYGPRTAEHLRGMFAIAVWDRSTRRLWLARDRFGVKPLYYVQHPDGTLWFASEIKALLAAGAVKPALNASQLPDYLANHAPSGDETLFAGVRRLPPGHTLEWEQGVTRIIPYWTLHWQGGVAAGPITAAQERRLVDEFRERFTEAVRIRLMADVPLGMFLSGGIDSAAITATMAGLIDAPVRTFSVAFAEREANELHYARLVAQRFATEHHEVVVSPESFWEALPSLVWHEDEPLAHPSSIPLHFVSRLAAEHVKVVLTGEGSDETLAGYNRYRVTVFNAKLAALYGRLTPGFAQSFLRDGIHALPSASRLRQRLERTFLARGHDLDALYFDNFAVFSRAAQARLLTPSLRQALAATDPYAAYHAVLAETDAPSLLEQLLHADTRTYLHELLMKQDQMSMAASIESRVPFLDHPLVEWVARLPRTMKLRGTTTKWILREAMRGVLPDPILSRGKMGFPVPVGGWLRGPWQHLVDEFVLGGRALERGLFEADGLRALSAEHAAGTRNHAERLWSLINLELWQRIFLDGEGHATPMPRVGARGSA